MNTQSILRAGMLAALCGIGPMAAVAGAAPSTAPVVHSTSVSLSDLDLSTTDGRRMARDRLHETARRLCSQVAASQDLSHQANFVACVDETLANALRQLDAPTRQAVAEKGKTWGIAAPPPVMAQKTPDPAKTRAATVWLGDLDLSSAEGARTARERVSQVARHLCTQVSDVHDWSRQSNYVECVNESTSAALRQLPGPALAAAQHARPGGATP
jgi:UrcA family protein